MGFGLFLIYSYHYPYRQDADTFKYFDDSKYMYDAFWKNPGDYFKMLLGFDNDQKNHPLSYELLQR